MQRAAILFFTLLLVFLAGCSFLNGGQPEEGTAVTLETPVPPTNTPPPDTTPDITISTPITDTKTTLTVWVAPELLAATEDGQATFLAQIDAFRTSHPDLIINVEPKATTGQGSILNYLRTGRTIAPDILPDLITLPSDQLASAYTEDLIFNLDGYLSPALFEDVFPAGQALTTLDEQTIAYPFILSQPPHLAYDTAVYTDTLPSTWEDFIALPDQTFVFPAAGRPGATLLLEMYLAAGGTIMNEAGQTELQLEPLIVALQQLSDGLTNEFILANSRDIQTLEDAWQVFQTGNTTFVQTAPQQYLKQQTSRENVGVAAIPGQETALTPLVSGWAWAISSTDSAKRPLAADLLTFLVDNPNLGEWSSQSRLLPARQGAMLIWPEEDPYTSFASNLLPEAEAHPFPPGHPVMGALGNAVLNVVSLSASPQVAAEEAIAALNE